MGSHESNQSDDQQGCPVHGRDPQKIHKRDDRGTFFESAPKRVEKGGQKEAQDGKNGEDLFGTP